MNNTLSTLASSRSLVHRKRTSGRRRSRTAAALVEFALVAPLMMLFTLGLIEMGRMTMVKQLLTNISREGARLASLPDATSTSVQTQVQSMLEGSKIYGASVAFQPTIIQTAPSGSLITVSISVPSELVSWLHTPLFMGGKTISASTVMRRESL